MSKNTAFKMLVVDDEELLRETIAQDFERRKFEVLTAENGTVALEIVKKEKIDIVLTDVRMPKGDGIELLRNIRRIDHATPIVMFITGFSDMSVEDAYHEGADAIFSKPFDRKLLFATVDKFLKPKEIIWRERAQRIDLDLPIQLKLPNVDSLVQTTTVNFGRGGLFVSITPDLIPAVGAEVKLSMKFDAANPDLEGTGIVRWRRTTPGQDLPTGFGLEFTYLNDAYRDRLIEFIAKLKTPSFIPKK